MASVDILVTDTPTAIPGLETDTKYTIANSGGKTLTPRGEAPLRVAIKRSAGEVNREGGFALLWGRGGIFSLDAGESLFVWHEEGVADFLAVYERAS